MQFKLVFRILQVPHSISPPNQSGLRDFNRRQFTCPSLRRTSNTFMFLPIQQTEPIQTMSNLIKPEFGRTQHLQTALLM